MWSALVKVFLLWSTIASDVCNTTNTSELVKMFFVYFFYLSVQNYSTRLHNSRIFFHFLYGQLTTYHNDKLPY
jgi:hypothetical protein